MAQLTKEIINKLSDNIKEGKYLSNNVVVKSDEVAENITPMQLKDLKLQLQSYENQQELYQLQTQQMQSQDNALSQTKAEVSLLRRQIEVQEHRLSMLSSELIGKDKLVALLHKEKDELNQELEDVKKHATESIKGKFAAERNSLLDKITELTAQVNAKQSKMAVNWNMLIEQISKNKDDKRSIVCCYLRDVLDQYNEENGLTSEQYMILNKGIRAAETQQADDGESRIKVMGDYVENKTVEKQINLSDNA